MKYLVSLLVLVILTGGVFASQSLLSDNEEEIQTTPVQAEDTIVSDSQKSDTNKSEDTKKKKKTTDATARDEYSDYSYLYTNDTTISVSKNNKNDKDKSNGGSGNNGGNTDSVGWLPENRFIQQVFDAEDIETQEIEYGTQTNFAGNPQALFMTINKPSATVDSETQRPVLFAFTGGDNAGFCDSTFAAEQAAMLDIARLGYVTVTLTPLLDDAFCDGEPAESYYENFVINHEAANKAINYLVGNSSLYDIDPESFGLYGYSIGGQTALLRLRDNYDGGPNVKFIAGFSSIVQDSDTYNIPFGNIVAANGSSPSVYLLSYVPDIGFAEGSNPDAEADCANLVTLGYDCEFQGILAPGHVVHPNTTFSCDFLASVMVDCYALGMPVVDDSLSVPAAFYPVLYEKLVEN